MLKQQNDHFEDAAYSKITNQCINAVDTYEYFFTQNCSAKVIVIVLVSDYIFSW